MNLNAEPTIIGMANSLDLNVECPVDAIMEYCRIRVRRFQRRARQITNVAQLQDLVCKRLNLAVHEIWNDESLEAVAAQFLDDGELAAFGAVKSQMQPDTFGMLLQLRRTTAKGKARFAAIIDCRGDKYLRRVFTLWHEIAHCLTAKDQLALPLRRTTAEIIEKDPVEKLTDMIAGDFAFYEPLFRPILESECRKDKRLTFRGVERIRDRFNSDASFVSTLHACVAKSQAPIVLVEAGMALKKHEQVLVTTGRSKVTDFTPSLRVLRSTSNAAARAAMPHVPKQMRVPTDSVIAQIFSTTSIESGRNVHALENLRSWTTSTGGGLTDLKVSVEARRWGDRVLALIAIAA